MRRVGGAIALAALALMGCYRLDVGKSYVDPDYAYEHVVKIAVLPILNKTSAAMAHERVLDSLNRQLSSEKHYTVIPTAKVMAALRRGGGAAAFSQLMNRQSLGAEIPDSVFSGLARSLDADAVFLATILSYHQFREDGTGVTMQGTTSYQSFPVSVVELSASLWGARSGTRLWRNEALERTYYSPGDSLDIAPAVDAALHSLLVKFPENTWTPAMPPSASPVPSPVTSVLPFPTPADPTER